MFELALRGQIPLISCTTNDPGTVQRAIMHIIGTKNPDRVPLWGFDKDDDLKPLDFGAGLIYVDLDDQAQHWDLRRLSVFLQMADATVVTVNPMTGTPPMYFGAGILPTPRSLVVDVLEAQRLDPEALMPALGGLTPKEINWLVKMASADGGTVTAESLLAIRRQLPPHEGLQHVSPVQDPSYVVPRELARWADMEAGFWTERPADPRLVPRGVLMDGPPGGGKTMGAKYIAAKLGVPLYRYNSAGVMNRYVGDSEKGIQLALQAVDRESPCVLLLDEVEKLFGGGVLDGGTTENVLATLLWWLQEHTSLVFVVMTTNDKARLPPELIRQGRIDETIRFELLERSDAKKFAMHSLKTYDLPRKSYKRAWREIDHDLGARSPDPLPSYAAVQEIVKAKVKGAILWDLG